VASFSIGPCHIKGKQVISSSQNLLLILWPRQERVSVLKLTNIYTCLHLLLQLGDFTSLAWHTCNVGSSKFNFLDETTRRIVIGPQA
jgi:hypothetical protein